VPADGVTIFEPPKTLRLEFNEPISPLVMRLVAPGGQISTLTNVTAENNSVTIVVPALPQQGTYVLSWRVISADGHPVGGVVSFSIGHPTRGVTAPPVVGAPALHAALWATQFFIFIGLFVGVGGAAFAAWLAAERPMEGQRLFAAVMIGGLFAALISLPLQGLDALAEPLAEIWQPASWARGFATSWSATVVIASATLAVGLFGLTFGNRLVAKILTFLAVVGIGLAFIASGHASTSAPRLLTVPSVFVHAVCITLWIGSLLPLALTVRSGDRVALDRFSRLIPAPLVLLIVTGIVLSLVELDRPDALWTTDYGLVLSAKLGLVVTLLALAAMNRYALVPRLAMTGTRRLVTVIATEFALALVILGVVGLWRFTPPPRALAATETTYIHFHAEPAMAQIDLTPERDRGAHVSIAVTDDDSQPVAAKEVTLVIWNPSAGIEPIRRNATFAGGSLWTIRRLRIPVAGVWRMRIEILVSDFNKVMIEDNVELPRAP
jgi:copper transport protein